MAEPDFDDLGVTAASVDNVEDAVLATATATAAAAEQDDFDTLLSRLDAQLSTLCKELRDLNARPVPTATSSTLRRRTTAKVASLQRRIDTLVTRRKTLVEARGERQRLADVTLTTAAMADDAPAQGESQRGFLIRTGKLTPFQGRQGYERHAEPQLKRRRVSSSQTASAAADVPPSHPQLRADVDQTNVVPEREPAVDQAGPTNSLRKRPRAASNYSDGDDRQPTPLSPLDDEYASDDHHDADEDSAEDNENDSDFMPDETSSPRKSSSKSRSNSKSKSTQNDDNTVENKFDDDDLFDSEEEAPGEVYDAQFGSREGVNAVVEEEEEVEFDGGLRVPASIYDRLFGYQRIGVQWLWELHSQATGGLLGDEMGLGKTVQIVAFLAALNYSEKLNGSVIILAPTTVLRQWHREFRAWWPRFRVRILHHSEDRGKLQTNGKRRRQTEGKFNPRPIVEEVVSEKHGVLITSYEQVRKTPEIFLDRFEYVVADEGHKMKSPDAEITLTCKRFNTPHRIIVSGSPLQNHLKELWSLFDFVYPGKLGTLPVFNEQFVVPITMGGYSTASKTHVHTAYKCSLKLRDLISPFLLRRMKKDVAKQLPEKTEQILFVKLTEDQRAKYKKFLASRFVRQVLHGKLNLLYGITALRKICNHCDIPLHKNDTDKDIYGSAYDRAILRTDATASKRVKPAEEEDEPDDYGNWKRAGKMIVLDRVLRAWHEAGSRVLLFSQTRTMLDILEKFVQMRGYSYQLMDGTTPVGSRMDLIDKFNLDETVFVFLLTTRVGGLGVNLTGADRVVLYDPDWNPSTDLQARERAWRIGQTRPVTVYRLVTTGTIEEKIYHRQIYKQFLTNKVLTDPRQRRFFKPKDMRDLFTLGDDDEKGTETGDIFAGTGAREIKAGKGEQPDKGSGKTMGSNGVSSNDVTGPSKGNDDGGGNASVLNSLLDDKDDGALHSTIDHDAIIGAGTEVKDASLMEFEADRVAEEALQEVKRSSEQRLRVSVAVPTWTGRSGLAGVIGTSGRESASGESRASSLLAKIKNREARMSGAATAATATGATNGGGGVESVSDKKERLMSDLIKLFQANDGQCTSAEVVEPFRQRVEELGEGVQLFKSMLKRVARLDKSGGPGKVSVWKLRDDARLQD